MGERKTTDADLLKQKASFALINVWFENEKLRLKRKSDVDPWSHFDNFRINHKNIREIKFEKEE